MLCLLHHQAVHETGEKLMEESSIGASDIRSRLDQLSQSWDELKNMAANRLDGMLCVCVCVHAHGRTCVCVGVWGG